MKLGDLSIKRDWGWAPEYVEAMWKMLQQKNAEDYVIATGKIYGLNEFVDAAFSALNLNWEKHVILNDSLKTLRDKIRIWLPQKSNLKTQLERKNSYARR